MALHPEVHPEVQKRAQEELDSVSGPNKLPTFEDRPNLPYIDAVVKESLRWHPVAPMGIPPKTIFGREEYMFDRFFKSSNAMRESLSMTIVCPKTVIELMGP
jgi:hypothetical protein